VVSCGKVDSQLWLRKGDRKAELCADLVPNKEAVWNDSGECLATKRAGDDDRVADPINRGSPWGAIQCNHLRGIASDGGILDGCSNTTMPGRSRHHDRAAGSIRRRHAWARTQVWCACVGRACSLAAAPYCVCTPCRLAAAGYDDPRGTSGNRDHLPHVQRRAHGPPGFHNGSRVLARLRLLLRWIPWAARIVAYVLEWFNVK
jgi:hypothetical protein